MTALSEKLQLVGCPTPFFRLLEIDAAESSDHSSSIQQVRDGLLTGIVVRNVYPESLMASVTERLERHDPPFVKTMFPEKFRSWFYGRNLNLMGTDPESYFQQAEEFHKHLETLLPGDSAIQSQLFDVLSQLDEQRPYTAAPGLEPSQRYMMTTLRGHAEGGYIPAHCDNEQSARPSYEHLQTIVGDHMYSIVLMIGAAEDGGDLKVYDHRIEAGEAGDNVGGTAGEIDTSQLSSHVIRLQPGDAAIVDSGRYLHQVTPVVGGRTRWVACSFMAKSLERDAVYTWG